MSLLSLVLSLRPLAAVADLPHVGRAAHALLLDVVRQADPALAQSIHDGSGLRPFTASDLLGAGHSRRLASDRLYSLRLTALTAAVSAPVLAASQAGPLAPGAVVTLGEARFRVEAADWGLGIAEPGTEIQNPKSKIQNPSSDWAAAATYEALSAPWLLGRERPAGRIALEFASPTTFKSSGKHVPVPLPGLVFGSLLEKWNAFAPVALPAETRRFAEECLALSAYDLRTRPVGLKEAGLRIGAAGQARYAALNHDRYWLSLINLLADFALFAGVGAGTGMGLGQCRRAGRA
jgi:CRISPR-associated endoribonuclease Cas6